MAVPLAFQAVLTAVLLVFQAVLNASFMERT